MKLIRKSLDTSREIKLNLDYKLVEAVTEEFLERWDIDDIIESWLQVKLEQLIDWDTVGKNLNSSKKKHKYQFNRDLFIELNEKVREVYHRYKNDELAYLQRVKGQEHHDHFEMIFDNVMNEIPLTMFEDGVSRVTLISYHYLLKVVNRLAADYMTSKEIKNINGTKNPTELFINELYNIIANEDELARFTLTIKSLIEQWLGKYNAKTKISDFYYDVLMISPSLIVEKILKYMLFTALRNKNPFVLRAIFSSYLTLIHKNLFSFYATNLQKVKLGYFRQLEGLFTESYDLIFDQGQQSNPKEFVLNSMIFNHVMRNKRYLKSNFSLLNDEYTQNFLEPNYFDIFSSYRKGVGMPFIDHMYFYSTNLKFTKNGVLREGNHYKLDSNFFKKNAAKKDRMIIKDLLMKHLWEPFFLYFKDEETVDEIFNGTAKDLAHKLNMSHYLTSDFKPLELGYDEYLQKLEKFVILMKKSVDDTSIRRMGFRGTN